MALPQGEIDLLNTDMSIMAKAHVSHEHQCNECLKSSISGDLNHAPGKISFTRKLLLSGAMRFAGWWSAFAGLLALNSVCPVCGSTACPVGLGTTGVIAAFFAALKQWGGHFFKAAGCYINRIFTRRSLHEENKNV